MKKSKKFILRMIPVLFMLMTIVSLMTNSALYATGVDTTLPSGGDEISTITDLGQNIWSTVVVIAQIAAFAAIVFAGVRYMFASADAKADIKKQTVILVVGAILVFGASFVVQLLSNIIADIS